MKKYWFTIFIFIQISVVAQIADYSLRNLPVINVLKIDEKAFESGKISVKFFRHKLEKMGDDATNILHHSSLQKIVKQYQLLSSNNTFKNILKNNDLVNKHKKWDLDLWFTIQFDKNIDVKSVYAALKKTNLFQVVEPVYKKHLLDDNNTSVNYTPNDPKLNEQWSYNNTGQGNGTVGKDIKLFDAWNIETGKPNVLVAVHDMGIQLDHPDLAQNIAVGKSFNFIDNNDTIVQGYHGTHTAGTIAAVNNNGIGVSGIAGGDGSVNSGVRLMSIQIFKGNQSAGLAEGFIYAADNGAAISSNSWAYDIENIYELSVIDAIDYFIENGGGAALQGGLVIFASGNVSRTIKYFPSAYDPVICVAATNNRDTKSNYSTFGSWVDIAAPGGDYNAGSASQILSTTSYGGYAGDHGTSMACPHVSGVAALIASKLSGKASASDVREILLSTTDNIDSLNPSYKGLLGTGRLNAFAALQKTQNIYNHLNILPIDSIWCEKKCDSIYIHWNKNSNNNDVVVAYNNVNGIGVLNNGTVYTTGDILPNGSTIIYKGGANEFSVINDNNFNYFKVWSVDAFNNYSFGKTIETKPQTLINVSGNYVQDFDFPPYFPTIEWRTINPNNDISWIHTAGDTSNTGAGDDYSMAMYNYSYNSLLGAEDILTSPIFNINNADSLRLDFWYAYKYKSTGLPVADSLEILVSNDCGTSYHSLWKKGGLGLATVSSVSDSVFYPFGIDKWQQVVIDVTTYKNANKLMFAFRSVNGKGNNLFLDNIVFDVKYQTDIAVSNILSPASSGCDTLISPQIIIANNGESTINTAKIAYTIDNGTVIVTNWSGNLSKGNTTSITLNATNVNIGNHNLKVYSFLPNNSVDNFLMNDTLCSNFFIYSTTKIPISENFESNIFPSYGWHIYQEPKDAITWVQSSMAGNSGSFKSCLMQNYYYDNNGRIDDLITPIFESSYNNDSCYLTFDYAHATRSVPTSANINFDSLEISYSNDCGTTWSNIWKKGGNSLQTIQQSQAYGIEFIPQSNQWKSDSILVTGNFNIADKVILRFRSIENFGNNIYIDNIKLFSKYTLPILTPVSIKSYTVSLIENNISSTKQVVNNWNTLEEINIKGYYIQRSIDGTNFKTIGFVKANGFASKYNFIDDLLNVTTTNNVLFYRLQIINASGKLEYSTIEKINIITPKLSVRVTPNPFTNEIFISNILERNNLQKIKIVNNLGQIVYQKNYFDFNSDFLKINGSMLNEGLYFLQLFYNNKTEVIKLIKIK